MTLGSENALLAASNVEFCARILHPIENLVPLLSDPVVDGFFDSGLLSFCQRAWIASSYT